MGSSTKNNRKPLFITDIYGLPVPKELQVDDMVNTLLALGKKNDIVMVDLNNVKVGDLFTKKKVFCPLAKGNVAVLLEITDSNHLLKLNNNNKVEKTYFAVPKEAELKYQ